MSSMPKKSMEYHGNLGDRPTPFVSMDNVQIDFYENLHLEPFFRFKSPNTNCQSHVINYKFNQFDIMFSLLLL